jgi:hypothetical protein
MMTEWSVGRLLETGIRLASGALGKFIQLQICEAKSLESRNWLRDTVKESKVRQCDKADAGVPRMPMPRLAGTARQVSNGRWKLCRTMIHN